MSLQEIANLRGFSKLKEGRDWDFELQLTEYGNLLSVNCDTISQMPTKINKCLLKNPSKYDIISNGLLLVETAGETGSLFQLTVNDI